MQIQVSWKPLDGFSWNFIFEYFTKIRPANSSFMKTTGRIFMEFYIWIRYEDPSSKFKFHENHWTDFHGIWYLNTLRKSVQQIQVSWKSDKNNRYFTWRPIQTFFLIISPSVLLRMRNFSSKVVGKIKIHFMSNNFYCKLCRLWDNVEKYRIAGQDTWQ